MSAHHRGSKSKTQWELRTRFLELFGTLLLLIASSISFATCSHTLPPPAPDREQRQNDAPIAPKKLLDKAKPAPANDHERAFSALHVCGHSMVCIAIFITLILKMIADPSADDDSDRSDANISTMWHDLE